MAILLKWEIWQDGRSKCDDILKRAGKYSVLHQHGDLAGYESTRKVMSPFIFENIRSREIAVAPDLLALAANCRDYSVRLNTESWGRTPCSLSIAVLALHLPNSEIIRNHEHDEGLLSTNIFHCARLLALDNFDPPVEHKKLTSIKSCRLVDVRLSQEGTGTSGRLWELHMLEFEPPSKRRSPNG